MNRLRKEGFGVKGAVLDGPCELLNSMRKMHEGKQNTEDLWECNIAAPQGLHALENGTRWHFWMTVMALGLIWRLGVVAAAWDCWRPQASASGLASVLLIAMHHFSNSNSLSPLTAFTTPSGHPYALLNDLYDCLITATGRARIIEQRNHVSYLTI